MIPEEGDIAERKAAVLTLPRAKLMGYTIRCGPNRAGFKLEMRDAIRYASMMQRETNVAYEIHAEWSKSGDP